MSGLSITTGCRTGISGACDGAAVRVSSVEILIVETGAGAAWAAAWLRRSTASNCLVRSRTLCVSSEISLRLRLLATAVKMMAGKHTTIQAKKNNTMYSIFF